MIRSVSLNYFVIILAPLPFFISKPTTQNRSSQLTLCVNLPWIMKVIISISLWGWVPEVFFRNPPWFPFCWSSRPTKKFILKMVLKTSPSLICRSGSRIGHRIPSRIPLSLLRRRYRSHVWAAPSHHSSREGSQTAQGRCDTPRSWNENVTSTSSCSSTFRDAVEEQCTESEHHFFQHGITFQNSKAETKAIREGGVLKMYPSNIEKVSLHVICTSLQDLKISKNHLKLTKLICIGCMALVFAPLRQTTTFTYLAEQHVAHVFLSLLFSMCFYSCPLHFIIATPSPLQDGFSRNKPNELNWQLWLCQVATMFALPKNFWWVSTVAEHLWSRFADEELPHSIEHMITY